LLAENDDLGLLRFDDRFQELGDGQRLDRRAVGNLDENAAVGTDGEARADRVLRLGGPIETTMISVAVPFSLRRTASSMAISSKGFIDIFTFARSIPDPSGFTRILTL
jgi:hypothetical protein